MTAHNRLLVLEQRFLESRTPHSHEIEVELFTLGTYSD
jgi:hypothetical protein